MTNTVETKHKRKQKRSPALIAGIILLVFTIILMITLAMFASFDEVTNVFNAGKVDIILTESNWNPENAKNVVPEQVIEKNPKIRNNEEMVDTYVFLKVVVPYIDTSSADTGNQLENNSNSKGTKLTETTSIPLYKFVVTTTSNNVSTDSYNTTLTSEQQVHNGWYLLSGYPKQNIENKTYTYVYAHIQTDSYGNNITDPSVKMMPLMAGHETQNPLFDKIRVVNFNEVNLDTNRDYSIQIDAYGIQANFLRDNNTTTNDPSQVWAMIEPSNG